MVKLEKAKTKDLLEEISSRGYQSTRQQIKVDNTFRFPRSLKPFKIGIVSDKCLSPITVKL